MSTLTSRPAFWKPGSARPGSSLDRSSEAEPAFLAPSLPPPSQSSSYSLPIFSQRLSILHALETHPVLIIVAETGSGKTTQIPQLLHSSGWASSSTIIACTQPRRIAATSIAAHVSSSMGTKLGQEVGYTIRFESHTSPSTRICYMTDGALFRECIRDPLLTRYSVIMVDEAHERGIYTDLLLGVLKKVLRKRPELRIVISSATVDAMSFKDFFEPNHDPSSNGETQKGRVKVLRLKGRSFPVHMAYLESACRDYVLETVETIWKIHLTEPKGDILAFLTGREEIESSLQMLADRQAGLSSSAAKMLLFPLHSGLSSEEQAGVFGPVREGNARKVVVATNIAEASITLDGVVYVVDCGLVKVRMSHPITGMESLDVVPISKASAVQRAGRAGRTREGKCFRLYTESFFLQSMVRTTAPELNRIDLSSAVLMLKSLGVDDLVKFDWLPPAPSPQSLAKAFQRLAELTALDEWGRLTQRGEWMAELPLPAHLARILIAAAEQFGCAQEILSIVAMLQITHPFYAPDSPETQLSLRGFAAQEGDLFTLLNVYLAFVDDSRGKKSAKWCRKHRLNFAALSRAVNIRLQLHRFLLRFSLPSKSIQINPNCSALNEKDAVERITKSLISGLYPNLAKYNPTNMSYTTVDGKTVEVHPNSIFFNRKPGKAKVWIVYAEATQAERERTWIRDVTVLDDLKWVTDTVPGFYSVKTEWGRSTGESAIHTSAAQQPSTSGLH